MKRLVLFALLAACGPKKQPETPVQKVEVVEAMALVGLDDCDPPQTEMDEALKRAQDVVANDQLRIKGCYERALEADKTVSGMVKVKVDIAESGKVTVAVLCTSVPAELTTCVVHSFEAMKFEPPPNGKKSLTMPVYLQPKGGPKAPACGTMIDPNGTKM